MSSETAPGPPVTAEDVRSVKFQLIRRGGYDPAQVDPFLELVAQTIEGGPSADLRIDGQYVHGVRFATVRRGGYLPAQVDTFLDRVIQTLDNLPARSATPEFEAPSPREGLTEVPATVTPQVEPADLPPPPPPPQQAPPPVAEEPLAPPPPLPPPEAVAPEPPQPLSQPSASNPLSDVDALDTTPEADFDRLRILHRAGVLSDKEFAVLGARVKRRIGQKQGADIA